VPGFVLKTIYCVRRKSMSEDRIEEEVILDFNALDEGLAAEGAKLKIALMSMLGYKDYFRMFPAPTKLRGTPSQISSFTAAVRGERKYMDAVRRNGLHDPATFSSKARLDRAVRNFERETGMKWPLQ
jgi:hypothetical protein